MGILILVGKPLWMQPERRINSKSVSCNYRSPNAPLQYPLKHL
jgi:hypothetical protein